MPQPRLSPASPSANEQQRLRLPFLLESLSTKDQAIKGRTGHRLSCFQRRIEGDMRRRVEGGAPQTGTEVLRGTVAEVTSHAHGVQGQEPRPLCSSAQVPFGAAKRLPFSCQASMSPPQENMMTVPQR